MVTVRSQAAHGQNKYALFLNATAHTNGHDSLKVTSQSAHGQRQYSLNLNASAHTNSHAHVTGIALVFSEKM
jgi:hypothetical protein